MDAKGWFMLGSLVIAALALVLTYLSRRDAKRAATSAKGDAAAAKASADRAVAAAERSAAAHEAAVALADEQRDPRHWLIGPGQGTVGFRLQNNTPRAVFDVRILAGGPIRDEQTFATIAGRDEVPFQARLVSAQGFRSHPFTVTWRPTSNAPEQSADLLLPPK